MRALKLLRDIRDLAVPYFRSEERWIGLGLLGAVIVLELAWVYATVLLNEWNSEFYNAIQEKDYAAFKYQLLVFCGIAAGAIIVAVYQIYLKQWLIIRWRRWLTRRYMDHWLSDDTFTACACRATRRTIRTSASPTMCACSSPRPFPWESACSARWSRSSPSASSSGGSRAPMT